MARNIRPSWLRLSVSGRECAVATGPRARSGSMSAAFDVREHGAIVSDFVQVDFIGAANGLWTTVRVTVRGKVVHESMVPQ